VDLAGQGRLVLGRQSVRSPPLGQGPLARTGLDRWWLTQASIDIVKDRELLTRNGLFVFDSLVCACRRFYRIAGFA
jgi:hypothetical protein